MFDTLSVSRAPGLFVLAERAEIGNGWKPDRQGISGAAIVLADITLIMFGPRDS